LVAPHPAASGSCGAKVSISGPKTLKRDELAVYRADYGAVADQQARVELIVPRGLLVDPERILPRSGVIAYHDGTTVVSWLRAQVPSGRVQIATRADPDLREATVHIDARLVEEISRCAADYETAVHIGSPDEASSEDAGAGGDGLSDPMDRRVGWTYYTPSAAPSAGTSVAGASGNPGVEPPHESILSDSPLREQR
jgi:hypothetical protein